VLLVEVLEVRAGQLLLHRLLLQHVVASLLLVWHRWFLLRALVIIERHRKTSLTAFNHLIELWQLFTTIRFTVRVRLLPRQVLVSLRVRLDFKSDETGAVTVDFASAFDFEGRKFLVALAADLVRISRCVRFPDGPHVALSLHYLKMFNFIY
jgi:hypothetical protein